MSRYDIAFDLESRNSLSILAKRIQRGSRVLEFGPATGRLTRYLKEELGCSVYAVELDGAAAVHLAPYCEDVVVGDIEQYVWRERFAGLVFDSIVFADVLEHLYYPERVLMACREFLREDGNILVSLPNVAHNAIVMELLSDRFTYRDTGLLDSTHIRFFTNSSFLESVQRCGLFCSYESAVYATAKESEFGYAYEDFAMGGVLQKREFGEVYQFLYELKGHACGERVSDFSESYKREEVSGIAKLYIDGGHGFCEEASLEIQNPHKKERLEFDVSSFGEIKSLRFDPFDNFVSLEMGESFMVLDDGREVAMAFVESNISYEGEESVAFLHKDSQCIFKIDEEMQKRVQKVVFVCKYLCFGDAVLDATGGYIREMKGSRGWKFVLLLRKLKRIFRA